MDGKRGGKELARLPPALAEIIAARLFMPPRPRWMPCKVFAIRRAVRMFVYDTERRG